MDHEESPHVLPASILRGLVDRSYDKRKQTTIEIQALVKALYDKGQKDKIVAIINLLAQEFTRGTNVNHRKGGVSGLAGVAVGCVSVSALCLCLCLYVPASSAMYVPIPYILFTCTH